MDFYGRSSFPISRSNAVDRNPADSHRRNSRRRDFSDENDEDMSSQIVRRELMNCMSVTISSASKKKILAEKNNAAYMDLSSGDHFRKPSNEIKRVALGLLECHDSGQHHSAMVCSNGDQSLITSNGSNSSPYDPLTNYTSPRPQFLRYNPNKRREILMRIEGELKEEEDGSELSTYSGSRKIDAESSTSSASSETYFQDREIDETKEMEDNAPYQKVKLGILWKMILLLGALLLMFYFPANMNTSSRPLFNEYMPYTESYEKKVSVLEITSQAPQIRTFSVNVLWVLMGLSDVCLDVPFRESACGIDISRSDSTDVDISKVSELLEEEAQFEKTEPLCGNHILPVFADILLENDDDVLVLEENIHQPNESGVFSTQSKDSGRTPDFAYKWNGDYETTKLAETHYSDHLMADSPSEPEVQDADDDYLNDYETTKLAENHYPKHLMADSPSEPEVQDADDDYLNDQDKVSQPHGSLDLKQIPSQKRKYTGIAESVDYLRKWTRNNILMFTSLELFQLLLVLVCFVLSVIGLVGLCKYYLRYPKMPAPSSLLSSRAIASQVEGEEKNGSAVSRQQLNVCSMPFSQIIGSTTSVKPPIVELLTEFSIAEEPDFDKGSVLTPKEGKNGSAVSKLSQHKGRPTRNGISSSSNKTLLSETSETNSISNRSSLLRKVPSKEEAGERVVAQVPTPLRRSARIRNRVTSP